MAKYMYLVRIRREDGRRILYKRIKTITSHNRRKKK